MRLHSTRWQNWQQARCRIRLFQIMSRLAETPIDTLQTCPIPETARHGRTLRQWRDQILAYVATGGVNNGGSEALNLIIDKTRRLAHGFRNLPNHRLCILLASQEPGPTDNNPSMLNSEEPD
jgi:transposase